MPSFSFSALTLQVPRGTFNNYVDRMRGGGSSKNVCFCQRSGYKNSPRRGGVVKKCQNSVHVVVEYPLKNLWTKKLLSFIIFSLLQI